ncbi:hypothetical protein [Enterocloster clostridioformis]|uniref:hypothetical protein n=1 Tax=Enterocloster clostridioformis TaxID=1531 RepID=UPI0011BECA4A|nr:hypothetical protein [Enterocloster clostridioformis]MCA5577244.1 hypothetical protein [Enterocloster clostridioformis]
MKWIIGAGKDIIQSTEQLSARSRYIRKITGADVTPWRNLSIKNSSSKFLICTSLDEKNGSFITAHIYDIILLSTTELLANNEFVVANTCIWNRLSDKKVLSNLMISNPHVRLWFAKQELSVIGKEHELRESNLLSLVGNFGFLTSKSERILFANRKRGFIQALSMAFEPVSPVFMPKDFGGLGWESLLKN